jgi:hypothetical protein
MASIVELTSSSKHRQSSSLIGEFEYGIKWDVHFYENALFTYRQGLDDGNILLGTEIEDIGNSDYNFIVATDDGLEIDTKKIREKYKNQIDIYIMTQKLDRSSRDTVINDFNKHCNNKTILEKTDDYCIALCSEDYKLELTVELFNTDY